MSRTNLLPTDVAAVVGVIDPDAYSATAIASNIMALKDFRRFMAVVQVGDIVSTGTVDAKLVGYTSAGGAGAADITGATITQMTQAGSDSNKQAVINLSTDSLAGSGFTHFGLTVTLGTAGADMGAIVLGFDPRYAPASDADAATVDSIKSV
jgi:hypothetical protein